MKLPQFGEDAANGDAHGEEITIPEIPEDASAREVGIALIQVVASLRNHLVQVIKMWNVRDRRRVIAIALTATGLVIDIGLSVFAFALLAGQHRDNQAIARDEAVISRQAAELHADQVANCQTSNTNRVAIDATWHQVLGAFLTPSASTATRQFVTHQLTIIDRVYQVVDCDIAFKS